MLTQWKVTEWCHNDIALVLLWNVPEWRHNDNAHFSFGRSHSGVTMTMHSFAVEGITLVCIPGLHERVDVGVLDAAGRPGRLVLRRRVPHEALLQEPPQRADLALEAGVERQQDGQVERVVRTAQVLAHLA